MSASDWLQIGAIIGTIVGVWFALVGWKLIPLIHSGGPFQARKDGLDLSDSRPELGRPLSGLGTPASDGARFGPTSPPLVE